MEELSIILPTYNERENIAILIPRVEHLLKREHINGEILVVDDSSPDGTADVARELQKKYANIKVIVRQKKEGLGAALREGYNLASGRVILSMDTDLSLDEKDIQKFLEKINTGFGLVVGSRHHKKGKYERNSLKTFVKSMVSIFGNMLTRFLTGVDVQDFSLNYRAIRKDVWKSIKTSESKNVFLLEMIVKSKHAGYAIAEIPVVFKDRIYGESKMKLHEQVLPFLKKAIIYAIKYRI
jgi:dolichol-phosphate mannosyltransferase